MESALVFSLPKVVYFVTQVLTQEDWNTVMYDGMRATSKWAALYFILLMTIGNYILFNLLVAILVEGFANQPVRFFICPSKLSITLYCSFMLKLMMQLNIN